MKKITLPSYLELLIRIFVGGTFVYASVDKIIHPDAFAQSIYYYRIVPIELLHPFALLLAPLELVTGLALLFGKFRKGASLLITLMLLVFMVAIISALYRDLNISCGCFNTDGGHAIGLQILFRDLVLLAGSISLLFNKISSPERL